VILNTDTNVSLHCCFALLWPQTELENWCTDYITTNTGTTGYTVDTLASQVYPDANFPDQTTTALQQCVTEQRYVRGAMTRALLYLQVSVRWGPVLCLSTQSARAAESWAKVQDDLPGCLCVLLNPLKDACPVC
jgi:hypothetical protein